MHCVLVHVLRVSRRCAFFKLRRTASRARYMQRGLGDLPAVPSGDHPVGCLTHCLCLCRQSGRVQALPHIALALHACIVPALAYFCEHCCCLGLFFSLKLVSWLGPGCVGKQEGGVGSKAPHAAVVAKPLIVLLLWCAGMHSSKGTAAPCFHKAAWFP